MPYLDYPVDIKSLQADERPKHWYAYSVTGRGPFPIDMLRHDRCWPASYVDAAKVIEPGLRSLRIHSYQEPRIGRWESFGWKVLVPQRRSYDDLPPT